MPVCTRQVRSWAACCRARTHLAARSNHDAYQSATLHSVALWCIAVGRRQLGSGPRSACTRRFWVISRVAWLRIGVHLDYSLVHGPDLCRGLVPRSKPGRSRPTTAAAAPATFRMAHFQVVGREQMAIAADTGYGHGLENTFRRKAHDMSFGCSKARPPLSLATICAALQRIAPPGYVQGLSRDFTDAWKSAVFRVTSVRRWTCAVAAMSASMA
jgi:hypothetical protein